MSTAPATWYLVADAARARIFTGPGRSDHLHQAAEFVNAELHGHARDVGTDRPGRTAGSVGGARHGVEPHVDYHREEKRHFAREIAEYVDKAALEGGFERLVLVAPAQMLGDLRALFGRHAKERVAAEIAKDLTKLPEAELMAQLRATAQSLA